MCNVDDMDGSCQEVRVNFKVYFLNFQSGSGQERDVLIVAQLPR